MSFTFQKNPKDVHAIMTAVPFGKLALGLALSVALDGLWHWRIEDGNKHHNLLALQLQTQGPFRSIVVTLGPLMISFMIPTYLPRLVRKVTEQIAKQEEALKAMLREAGVQVDDLPLEEDEKTDPSSQTLN